MKCYTLTNKLTIKKSADLSIFDNQLSTPTKTTNCSVRLVIGRHWDSAVFVESAKNPAKHDILLHSYTQLIEFNGESTLFPKGSALVLMPINLYKPIDYVGDCSKLIQVVNDMCVVGCPLDKTFIQVSSDSYLIVSDKGLKLSSEPLNVDAYSYIADQEVTILEC